MTNTVMQVVDQITEAHQANRLMVSIRSSKHTAQILGCDTLDIYADTALTESQASALRSALAAEFGATVTKIGR